MSKATEDAHGSQLLSKDEICDQVLGRRLSYSKGLGWGPKPKACKTTSTSSYSTSCSQSTERETQLQAKLDEALERIERIKEQTRNHQGISNAQVTSTMRTSGITYCRRSGSVGKEYVERRREERYGVDKEEGYGVDKEEQRKKITGNGDYGSHGIKSKQNYSGIQENGDELRLTKGSSGVEGEETQRSNRNDMAEVQTETVGILRDEGDDRHSNRNDHNNIRTESDFA
ncbi:uncharacterized protein E5676_scaffold252G00020 [Cucumis melo var. makuwa]|uniref:Zinc finger protein ZPR1-like protein n=1 Tax=Cucumis melo var. makuwa TaxID=1194695 RepID=A0A5D3BNK9_CUCMM|nr:uncharacterized protein E6C27_scaffold84G001750 [Cucumis melo var. makuwa]TYJ99728.1 uncharacterized protein E5676_scaffold252G00020 [Cucumis melo var. makuwa]